MAEAPTPAPTWKIVLAAILDFLTVFFVAGYVIGWLLGGLTNHGFNLTGFPALLLLVAIIAYFVLGKRVFGGTVWNRILGTLR
jgi:hypothetical protein